MKYDIRAIAFDLDGTLVDSLDDLTSSANAMRTHLGMESLSRDILMSFVGDGVSRLVHRALTNHHDQWADDDLWKKGFSFYARHYAEHLTDNTRPYDQVLKTLKILRAWQYPLALVTNKSAIFAQSILKNLNLINEFSLIIGGDSLSDKKPSSIPLNYVCEQFNIESNQLLMVGDSRNDALAAKSTGSLCALVNFGYGNIEELNNNMDTKPDVIISDFSQLIDFIRPLNQHGKNSND